MAEIVNLRKARKHKARALKEERARANRLWFGRTGEQKRLEKARREHARKTLEGHRLRSDETDGPGGPGKP